MDSTCLEDIATTGRRANNFDLLRLIAALFVLFAHSFNLLGLPAPFPKSLAPIEFGFIGVLIFFSISGFLVARSWSSGPQMGTFLLKRALRLLPALLLSLMLCAFVLGPLVTTLPLRQYFDDPTTKSFVLNNILFQSDYSLPGVFAHLRFPVAVNGSLWTLPIEVKAYVFIAVVGLCGVLTRRPALMLVIAVLVSLCMVDSVRSSLPGANHFVASLQNLFATPAESFLAARGVFDLYIDFFAAFVIGASLFALRSQVMLRGEVVLATLVAWLGTLVIGGQAPVVGTVIIAPYVLLWLAYRTHRYVRLPQSFGDYSYGIYIFAFPVQQTVSLLFAPNSGWVMFALSLPVTVALAVLSWHYIETSALALKKYVAPRPIDLVES
jgi:peptidoglycan/LPS O-acetylase OafA/YrhL